MNAPDLRIPVCKRFSNTMTELVFLTRDQAEALLADVLEMEGLSDGEVIVNPGMEKGDGYCSVLTKIDVNKDGKELHLLVKEPPRNREVRKIMPIDFFFNREIYMYQTVFQEFSEIQKQHSDPFHGYSRCYKARTKVFEEAIVLEHLKYQGFKLHDRFLPMDDNHLRLALAQYAKLHGTSYALRYKNPEKFQILHNTLKQLPPYEPEEISTSLGKKVESVKKLFSNNGPISDKLTNTQKVTPSLFQMIYDNLDDPYNVIRHADCWNNNMLFKYGDNSNLNKPTDLKFIDFQNSGLGLPVLDLSYFFYTSADKLALSKLEDYLKCYHQFLTHHLNGFGIDVADVYPFKTLKAHWKEFGKFGFVLALNVIGIMLSDKEDREDFTDIAKKGGDLADLFDVNVKNVEGLNIRYKDLVEHVVDNDFI